MTVLEFRLPDVGEGLAEAEISVWHVSVGEQVERDQVVVDVQTDKANVEIPAPAAGTVMDLVGSPGDIVGVGTVLFTLKLDQEEAVVPPTREKTSQAVTPARAAGEPLATETASSPGPRRERLPAAPSTRKLATDLGVDLTLVEGSGPGGRILRQDVEAAAAKRQDASPTSSTASAPGDRIETLKGVRRRVAQAMTEALKIPHITEFAEIDALQLVQLRSALQSRAEDGLKLTFLPFFIRACSSALIEHPSLNASIDMDESTITYRAQRNIGIAMAHSGGLLVPVIHDAAEKSLPDLAREVASLSRAVNEGTLRPDQMSGGTFTISNFGSYGTWLGTPLIKHPEVAIAGFGRIRNTVVPISGVPEVRPTLPIAVSADHRLIDGDVLGAFVKRIAEQLINPFLLFGDGRMKGF